MTNLLSVNYRPSKDERKKDEDRVKFVEFIASVTEMYLNGDIDVISIGFVDEDGIPRVEYGSFPVNFGNDVLALGVEASRESSDICDEARALIKNGA